MTRRVVITGVGAVTPLGIGSDPLIDRWTAGESGIADGFGRCLDFEPTDFLSKKEVRRADRFAQMGIVAGDEAVKQAFGEDGELPYDPYRVGCVIATGIGGLVALEREQEKLITKGPKAVSPLAVPLMMGNAAAAAVSMRHGLQGHTYAVSSACAAGNNGIGDAARIIQVGDADAMVTGGAEACIPGVAPSACGAMEAPSASGISRPFDARRDGFVMGEGAGVLVLEEMEAAEKRGATILGEVIGYGVTADAYHLTAPPPEGEAAAKAISFAMADAGMSAGGGVYRHGARPS